MANARSEDFKLEQMRGHFLHVVKPQKRDEGGTVKLSYNGTFLWPKTTPALLGKTLAGTEINVMDEAVKVAVAQWGDKAVQWIKDGVIKSPFLDGDGPQGVSKKTGERHNGFAGHRFIRASANVDYPPTCIDAKFGADGKPVVVTDANRMYWGAYYHIVVNMFAWEHPQNGKGLSFGLSMIQFAKDGEKLGTGGGGGVDASKWASNTVDPAAAGAPAASGSAGGLFA